MNRRVVPWLLAFSLGLNAVLIAGWLGAGERRDGARHDKDLKRGKFYEISAEELNLSGARAEEWETVRREQNREILRMRAMSLARLEQLNQLMQGDNLTTQSLHALLDDMKSDSFDYAANMLESYMQQREILDSAEESQLLRLFQQRLAGMRDWSRRRLNSFSQQLAEQYGEAFVQESLAGLPVQISLKEPEE